MEIISLPTLNNIKSDLFYVTFEEKKKNKINSIFDAGSGEEEKNGKKSSEIIYHVFFYNRIISLA